MQWMAIIGHLLIGYALGIALFKMIKDAMDSLSLWPHRIKLVQSLNVWVILIAIFILALN